MREDGGAGRDHDPNSTSGMMVKRRVGAFT